MHFVRRTRPVTGAGQSGESRALFKLQPKTTTFPKQNKPIKSPKYTKCLRKRNCLANQGIRQPTYLLLPMQMSHTYIIIYNYYILHCYPYLLLCCQLTQSLFLLHTSYCYCGHSDPDQSFYLSTLLSAINHSDDHRTS